MANTKSAKKANRASVKKNEINTSRKNRIKTFIRKVESAIYSFAPLNDKKHSQYDLLKICRSNHQRPFDCFYFQDYGRRGSRIHQYINIRHNAGNYF